MNIIKNPMYLNYVKKFICIFKRKSNQSQEKQQLISSSEIIPFFSLKGKLKTSAKITKVTGKTECNVFFNYNGEITKFAVRLYGLESLKDTKNITCLDDLIPPSGIVYLVAHNFDTDGKLEVLKKKEIKELIGRSPDFTDAMMMRMYFDLKPAMSMGSVSLESKKKRVSIREQLA